MGYELHYPQKSDPELNSNPREEEFLAAAVPGVPTAEEPVQQTGDSTEAGAELDPSGSTAGSLIPEHIRETRVGLARRAPIEGAEG